MKRGFDDAPLGAAPKLANQFHGVLGSLSSRERQGRHVPTDRRSTQHVCECSSIGEYRQQPCDVPAASVSTIALTFSPCGSWLACSHGDHSICVYDSRSGRLQQKLNGHCHTAWQVAFNPGRVNELVSASKADPQGGEMIVWDHVTGEVLATEVFPNLVTSLSFHPTGNVLVITSGWEVYFNMSTPRNSIAAGYGSSLSSAFKENSFRFFRDGPDESFYRAVKLAPDCWAGSPPFRERGSLSGSFGTFTGTDWPGLVLPLLCVSSVSRAEGGGKWKNNSTLTLCRAVLAARPDDSAAVIECQRHLKQAESVLEQTAREGGFQRNKFREQDSNLDQGYCGIVDMEDVWSVGPGLYHNNSAAFSPCSRFLTYFNMSERGGGSVHCVSPSGERLKTWSVHRSSYLMTSVGVSPSSTHVVIGFASHENNNHAGQVKIFKWDPPARCVTGSNSAFRAGAGAGCAQSASGVQSADGGPLPTPRSAWQSADGGPLPPPKSAWQRQLVDSEAPCSSPCWETGLMDDQSINDVMFNPVLGMGFAFATKQGDAQRVQPCMGNLILAPCNE